MTEKMTNNWIEIGAVTQAVGLKGAVRVKSFAEDPVRFKMIEKVVLEREGRDPETHSVETAGIKGGMVNLKLAGVDDRDSAERLRGYTVYMDPTELGDLEEGSYYVRDLIGMKVVDFRTGGEIGTLRDVLTDRPQDLYIVEPGPDAADAESGAGREHGSADDQKERRKDIMIPAVDEFIKEIDKDDRIIKVELIEGMVP